MHKVCLTLLQPSSKEMAALALFNLGNVHLSKARKRVLLAGDSSTESISTQVKTAYDWAQNEYVKAGMRYKEALKVKPDFYEGLLALGQQQFEQAKLSWSYVIGSKAELDIGESAQVLEFYNKAEDNMEKGIQMWEEMEEERLNGLSKYEKDKLELRRYGLDGLFKDISADEAAKQAANMRSQIYLIWGTMLNDRSVVEYKLSLPTWEVCLELAIVKFQLAEALETDITVMIKNHCSNETALEGFKVDEMIQAWNEMYDADRWRTGADSAQNFILCWNIFELSVCYGGQWEQKSIIIISELSSGFTTLIQVNYCLNLLWNSFDQDSLAFLNNLHYACSVYLALDIYCTLL